MKENHKKFLKHLDESVMAVEVAAEWLKCRGYDVKINKIKKAPSHSEWKKYADNGDLWISLRVEVKRLSVNFTCKADWPFGKHFIVCAKHSFDNAHPKPYGFIYLNTAMTHLAIVMSYQKNDWYVEERIDSRYDDYKQEFYIIDISKVIFCELIS